MFVLSIFFNTIKITDLIAYFYLERLTLLKMSRINITVNPSRQAYIFFFVSEKNNSFRLLTLLEADPRCLFRSRNFLIKTNKKLPLYGVQQTVLPPMIVLPSICISLAPRPIRNVQQLRGYRAMSFLQTIFRV